jgi:hypothetical protein
MGPLVALRIEEVLVGCLVSFAVAILMMPLAATRHVEAKLGAVLEALRGVVRFAGSAVQTPETAPAMRKLDRAWHDLRIALKPLQTQRVVVWNPDVEMATASLLCCLHWARVLSDSSRRGELSGDVALNLADVSAAHVQSIVVRLDSLIARYQGGVAGSVAGELDGRVLVASAVEAAVGVAVEVDPAKASVLAQLDGAVAQLFERLTQPVVETRWGFNWALRGRSA